MPTPDFTKYLQTLEKSRLIEPAGIDYELERYWQLRAADSGDVASFGQFLIEAKLLTRWQHEKLALGRFKGFQSAGVTLVGPLGAAWSYLGQRQGERMVVRYVFWHERPNPHVMQSLVRRLQGLSPRAAEFFGGPAAGMDGPKHGYIRRDFFQLPSLERVVNNRRLRADEATDICLRLADGLVAAHEAGIHHGRLAPSNIFCETAGPGIRCADLGVGDLESFALPENRSAAHFAFTPPENNPLDDPRGDIFSLGRLLFWSIGGNLSRGAPRFFAWQGLDASPRLSEVCCRMMAERLEDRFGTMLEVREALRSCQRGE